VGITIANIAEGVGIISMDSQSPDNRKLLSCGHPVECWYFHPALRGGMRHRCIACDDPEGNSRAMQELIERGIIELPAD
jgi:hypothetical protein